MSKYHEKIVERNKFHSERFGMLDRYVIKWTYGENSDQPYFVIVDTEHPIAMEYIVPGDLALQFHSLLDGLQGAIRTVLKEHRKG